MPFDSLCRRCLWVFSSITRPLLNARHMLPIPPPNLPGNDTIWEANHARLTFAEANDGPPVLFVGLRPVTEAQYNDLTATRPYAGDGSGPVVGVTWCDAVEFCNALSAKEGLRPYYTLEFKRPVSAMFRRRLVRVERDTDAVGFRLPTLDELRVACDSANGARFYDAGSEVREWCDDARALEGSKVQRVFMPRAPSFPGNQDPAHGQGSTTFRVVKSGNRGLSETSADGSFSDETRLLIKQIQGTGGTATDRARVHGLLVQTVRYLAACAKIGTLRLACWCVLAIALWAMLAGVVGAGLLFLFPAAVLEPVLYVLAGVAIVGVAVVRLTQFDTAVHLAPPDLSETPLVCEVNDAGSSAKAGSREPEMRGSRKNDRFLLGRLDDLFDPRMLVGLWGLVGILIGVQVAIAFRVDQANGVAERLWNASWYALDTTAGGLLLNSLDTLGISSVHEAHVPAPLTLALRFMTFGLICWAILWNNLRVRLFYVHGLFRDCPTPGQDIDPDHLAQWYQKKTVEFWWLPTAYADETAFLSIAMAFAQGDDAYVRTLSRDFHGVNVKDDIRQLFRAPDGQSTFEKGWKSPWKRDMAQWLWSAAKTWAAWVGSALFRLTRRGKTTVDGEAGERA
jgi:hypothetical protein